ncbi:hypothetical protein ACIP5Y_08705 [Nocardia sp. NPDC088792]|uniref:hypothetical protein n=1 Tax=Nocardia sp. NPDC088792 TaxID=3364332 RepID=UPI00380BAA15
MTDPHLPRLSSGISRRAFTTGALAALGGAALYASGRPPMASARPAAESYGLTVDPATHTVGRDFFGVNGARIISAENARQWHDPAFRDALAAVGPGLIRVQGGTTSQWLDWRTGLFEEDKGGGFGGRNDGRPPLLLTDWAELVRNSGATAVFDLNVLNATLDDQLDMLREARRLGLPVRYVELGNELWVPGRPYTTVFPTGADYARAMNDWIPAIRREFPQARIGVSAAVPMAVAALSPRYADWNDGLFATIRDADAAVFHPYWVVDPVAADIASTAGGGVATWTDLAANTLSKVPAGMDIWITEYNQMGREATPPLTLLPPVRQTWAVGLSVASFTLRALLDPRMRMAVMHCALNGVPAADTGGGGTTNQAVHALISDGSGGSELFGRTALNWALTPIYRSMTDGAEVSALRLDPGVRIPAALLMPPVAGPVDACTGVQLSAPGLTTGILVNTSDRPLRITLPPSLAGAQEATIYTAAPTAAPAFEPGVTISAIGVAASDHLDVPAYSEAVLRKR